MQCNKAPGTIKKPNRARINKRSQSEPKENAKKRKGNASRPRTSPNKGRYKQRHTFYCKCILKRLYGQNTKSIKKAVNQEQKTDLEALQI